MSDKCCNIKLIDTINQQLKRLNWCKQLLQFRLFHRSRTKLWEGNVFSRVFLSVHMGVSDVTITHDILDLTNREPPPPHTQVALPLPLALPPLRGADICWIPEACTVGKGAVRILLVCLLLLTFSNRDINIKINTRMHSSRMRTVRSSSHVYPSMHLAGGVYPSMQGGSAQGVCIPACRGGLPRGCVSQHALGRGVYPSMQGGSAQGVCIPACTGADTPP